MMGITHVVGVFSLTVQHILYVLCKIHRSASCLGVAALAVMNISADSGPSDSPLHTLGRGVLSQKIKVSDKSFA